MENPNRDVFVSYASKDRSAVLSFVDALSSRGVRFWIDRNLIEGGGYYAQEIPRAIEKAKGVMLFASRNAFDSPYVLREVDLAVKRRKPIIPLFLDRAEPPESFVYLLATIQSVYLDEFPAERRWTTVIDPLSKWGISIAERERASDAAATKLISDEQSIGSQPMTVGSLTPYMVDRVHQERALREALLRHSLNTPRRPLILMVCGKLDQAIYEYAQRIERSSIPKLLKFVGYSDHVRWVNLPWTQEDWQSDPARAISRLQGDIEAELSLRHGVWPEPLMERVSGLRSSLVLCYRLSTRSWNETHIGTLAAYLQTWACIPELPPKYPLILFVLIQYPVITRGLLDNVDWLRKRERPLFKRLEERLKNLDSGSMALTVLPELGNVTFQDIEDWILNQIRPPDPIRMIRQVKETLNDLDNSTDVGLPMNALIDRLYTLVEMTAREQTKQ